MPADVENYRVVDVRAEEESEVLVSGARSPELAAERASGIKVVRSGARQYLVARVYFERSGQPMSMVRVYEAIGERRPDRR